MPYLRRWSRKVDWPNILPTQLKAIFGGLAPTYAKTLTPPDPPPPYYLNTDRSAAVSTETFYNEDIASCPRGAKVILLTAGGVAVLGRYTGDAFYVGWHALPRKKQK